MGQGALFNKFEKHRYTLIEQSNILLKQSASLLCPSNLSNLAMSLIMIQSGINIALPVLIFLVSVINTEILGNGITLAIAHPGLVPHSMHVYSK